MFMFPMLLETRDGPFSDEKYLYELKFDGHRMVLHTENGNTRLYTRHGNEVTALYPELQAVPLINAHEALLDGEVVALDPATNKPDLDLLNERFLTRKEMKRKRVIQSIPVQFVVFDIMRLNGKDLRQLPLRERKHILSQVLEDSQSICKVNSIEGKGEALFQVVKNQGLEGVVAKRIESKYVNQRSGDWLKIINWSYERVYLTGYRKDEFGWLIGVEEAGKIRPVGMIEFGAISPEQKKAFYKVSRSIVTGENKDFVFLQPALRANVKFRCWTRNRMMRTPVFLDFDLGVTS